MKNPIHSIWLFLAVIVIFGSCNDDEGEEKRERTNRGKIVASKKEKTVISKEDLASLGINRDFINCLNDTTEYITGYVVEWKENTTQCTDTVGYFKVLCCEFPCWFNFGCAEGDFVKYKWKDKEHNTLELIGYEKKDN